MNRNWPSLIASLVIFGAIVVGMGWASYHFGRAPLIEQAAAGVVGDRR